MDGVTGEEMAMTNGAGVMVPEQVLFRYQIQLRCKAKVEGRIMRAAIGCLTGEVAEHQIEIPLPRLRGQFRRYGRILRPPNNYLNLAPSHKVRKRHASACLTAV